MEITQKEQEAWHAGIAAGREIERHNAAVGQPSPRGEPIHQYRVRNCSDWYDGLPDASDGKDYETRTLYSAPVAAQAQPIQWPIMPTRKGQSPVLFEDGYDEGWAKCLHECQKAASRSEQPVSGADGVPELETCQRCQGNGEIVTDWERYKHPAPGDVGDEAVTECPDCHGTGNIESAAQPQPSGSGADGLDAAVEKAWSRFQAAIAPTDDELEEFAARYADEQGGIHDDTHAEMARALLDEFAKRHLFASSEDGQPQPSGNASLHPAIREGIEAAFEQRDGWLAKVAAAVRHLPDNGQSSGNAGEDERAEFEAWAATQSESWLIVGGLSWSPGTNDYASARTNAAFAAWKARAALAAQADSDVKWRDLALQFDGHRMQALAWLKQILAESPDDAWPFARTFLKSPPMSGEAVLAERIEALAAQASGQDREDVAPAEWMEDDGRAPWAINSLKARIKEMRASEKRCRNAFRKDYMRTVSVYFADALGESAEALEKRLAVIDAARAAEKGE